MQTFAMTRSRSKAAMIIVGLAVVPMVVGVGAFAYVLLGARTVRVEADRVVVDGTLYSTELPRKAIDRAGVRVVDLDHTPELAISHRTNGLGLPGLLEGWIELENGRKAFGMLTDRSRVVVVPNVDPSGPWLLLSVADGDQLVAQLK